MFLLGERVLCVCVLLPVRTRSWVLLAMYMLFEEIASIVFVGAGAILV